MAHPAIANLNDGTAAPPRLRADLNLGTVWELPPWSAGPRGPAEELYAAIAAAGFEGVQGGDPARCAAAGLACTTFGSVARTGELHGLATLWRDLGFACATLHVGTGMEGDDDARRLLEEVVGVSAELSFPLYVETHRATLTQDIARTVQFVEWLPELRFNGDFSHWYTGLEMTYGDFDAKLAFLAPVFERTCFLHGRIGDPGAIQIPLRPRDASGEAGHSDSPSIDHFRRFWAEAARGFLGHAGAGDVLVFAPELLPSIINYARTVPVPGGGREEESDRWLDALEMTAIAYDCFAAAAA